MKRTKHRRSQKVTWLFVLCLLFVVANQPSEAKADPISDILVGTLVGDLIGTFTWGSVLGVLARSLITSAIFGGLGALLSKKPKADPIDSSRTQMLKEPITARQVILGRARVSGAITFISTYDNYKRAEYNVTIAGHPCDAVEQVYFDSNLVTLDSNGMVISATDEDGNADDTWVGSAWVHIGLGTPDTDAAWLNYAVGQTAGDWTVNHKQTGCTKVWITLNVSGKPGGSSIPNISAVVRGLQCYDPRNSNTVWTMNPALCLRQYLIQVGIINADGSNVDDAYVTSAANTCDELVESPGAISPISKVWVQAGAGIAVDSNGVTVWPFSTQFSPPPQLINFAAAHPFVTGDTITVSMVPTGSPHLPSALNIYTTYTVFKYSATQIALLGFAGAVGSAIPMNAAISLAGMSGNLRITKFVTAQYYDAFSLIPGTVIPPKTGEVQQISSTGTLPGGFAINTDYYTIVLDAANNVIQLAASLADAQNGVAIHVSSVGTGTVQLNKAYEQRYTCNGALTTDTQPIDALPNILSSFVGSLVYVGGKWIIYAGAYSPPTLTFDENDLDGNPTTTTRISLRDNFNAVKGTYYNPAAFYEQDSFPPVTNQFYVDQDGTQVWNAINLPFTNSSGICQRISKALLEIVRQPITTQWPMKMTAMQFKVGDIVMLNRTRLGWVNKPFQCTNWNFALRTDSDNMRLGIDVTFREVASTMYDWNSGEETTVDLAPNSNLPNPFVVDQPGAPTIVEREVLTADSSTVKSVVDITWLPSDSPNLVTYLVEYKLHTDTIFTALPLQDAGHLTATINAIDPGIYDFQVTAINNIQARSKPAINVSLEVYGQLPIPEDITGLTIQEVSALGVLRWSAVQELAVRVNGTIHIRHTEAAIGSADISNSVEIVPAVAGSADHAVVPLKAGTYLVYAVNTANAISANPAKISSANASIQAFSTFNVVQEDPTFSGTNSGTAVDHTGHLVKLAGSGLWDSITDFDSIPDVDDFGGTTTTGVYTFGAGINLGAAKSARLLTRLQVLAVNSTDNLDLRTGNIDDWTSFDGLPLGIIANAYIQVRTTQTDPTASPTWSAWNALVNADYSAWGYQFQLVISTIDPQYNLYVSALGVTAQLV